MVCLTAGRASAEHSSPCAKLERLSLCFMMHCNLCHWRTVRQASLCHAEQACFMSLQQTQTLLLAYRTMQCC